jgi:hypothetical protein
MIRENKMKKNKRLVLSFMTILFMGFVGTTFTANAKVICPNYATSKEVGVLGLYYDGYIQFQSSYNENKTHVARGHYVYKNGADGTKNTYTDYGNSSSDTSIHSASSRYRDKWNPIPSASKTSWSYNFSRVKHGSSSWPI